jgi:3-oxoacyl-[acyl-carrier-protein] synthase II
MRPFDQGRDGFVPNVGVGCLVLENAERAQLRGATIYGFLDGWAMNTDATHMTAMCPSGASIARSIELSMRRAHVQSVDYINAHGTATHLNDQTEARGIVSALGKSVPVSSTKPLTGHLLGAAGAVEAVISLLALRENFIPPTLNLHNQDPECYLDCVPNVGRERVLERVLSLNYGFGGHIGTLLFSKT